MNQEQRTALEHFIAEHAQAGRVTIRQLSRLSGGAIQDNWLLDLSLEGGPQAGELAVVLRTDAPSAVQVSHSRAQEFALLKVAFAAGVTVPEPLWLCENKSLLGRPFFIMRRVGGTAAAHRLVKDSRLGGDRRVLAERLGEELARIHAIRPPQTELAFLPLSAEAPARRAIRRFREYLDSHPQPHPLLEWGLRWLERHAPPPAELVLCHRDYRTGNYMVDEQGLTGILDWEFAGWSDPLEDIGWFCARCWRFGAPEREAGGIGEREDFYRGYERAAGRPLAREQVYYWEVLAHVNWAVIALQQAARQVSGEEDSLLLALTGQIVPELEYEILRMTEND